MAEPVKDERKVDKGLQNRVECPADACHKPEEAADSAVKKVFAILGVDVDKPEDIEQFRVGLRFGEELHKYAKYGMLVMVSVFAAAIMGTFIFGVFERIRHYITPGSS